MAEAKDFWIHCVPTSSTKDVIVYKEEIESPYTNGMWLYNEKVENWECSGCHCIPTKGLGSVLSAERLFKYCPNCGAKMDGE